MKKHLIQKKSAVALQSHLSRTKKGNRSIESFGTVIEDLFVNLTFAQADGDGLPPVNTYLLKRNNIYVILFYISTVSSDFCYIKLLLDVAD